MSATAKSGQSGAVSPRLALVALLVAATLLTGPRQRLTATQAAGPHALLTADKPGWRGTDPQNTGRLRTTGPTSAPTTVFSVQPAGTINEEGVELDAQDDVISGSVQGVVTAYAPD